MPNGAHRALAELEKYGIIKAVLTQNIDGLHTAAGSKNVIELHGTAEKYYCMRCGAAAAKETVTDTVGIPRCACGGIIRPRVTLYGEPLSEKAFTDAVREVGCADVLVVGGSSLTVYPAASFAADFRGEHLIIINKSPTPYDEYAEIVCRESIADVLTSVAFALGG